MDLLNDLDTDLAFAFLVEKRYQQKIDSKEALALIGRVKSLLERLSRDSRERLGRVKEQNTETFAAH